MTRNNIYDDYELGQLRLLNTIFPVQPGPARTALKRRTEAMAAAEGIFFRPDRETRCKQEHGVSVGVTAKTVGVIWDYVSISPLHRECANCCVVQDEDMSWPRLPTL